MAREFYTMEKFEKLIQQIHDQYQEGVDYHHTGKDSPLFRHLIWITKISPRLEKFLKEKLGFPSGVNDYLDYEWADNDGNDVICRMLKEGGNGDWCLHLSAQRKITTQRPGEYQFNEEEKPKKCAVCDNLTLLEERRMKLWDGEKWRDEPNPNIMAYFHPECAEKYFANPDRITRFSNSNKNLDKNILQLLTYFQKNDIQRINLSSDNKLTIIYRSGSVKTKEKNEVISSDNSELQTLLNFCQARNIKTLSEAELFKFSQTNSENPTSSKDNNYSLAIALGIGGGIVVLGIIVIFLRRKKQAKK